jgi:NAD(P)-dependent dehydrogenase (short-subunit alcohol dehydrogenase family)
LVNNAGKGQPKSLLDTDDAELDDFLAVNTRAAFRLSRAAMRQFVAAGSGSVVQAASVFGFIGRPGSSAYAASKAALIGLTHQMAADYGPLGVRTNAVAPGLIATPMTQERLDRNPRFRRLMVDTTPARRIGRPEDVAAAVASRTTWLKREGGALSLACEAWGSPPSRNGPPREVSLRRPALRTLPEARCELAIDSEPIRSATRSPT